MKIRIVTFELSLNFNVFTLNLLFFSQVAFTKELIPLVVDLKISLVCFVIFICITIRTGVGGYGVHPGHRTTKS